MMNRRRFVLSTLCTIGCATGCPILFPGVSQKGEDPTSRLRIHQLLSGKDFAIGNPDAVEMVNFSYLISDRQTGDCMAIDPSWGPIDILRIAEQEGLRLAGIIATHYHWDHVGGKRAGYNEFPGVKEMVSAANIPVHCHALDATAICQQTGLSANQVISHVENDVIGIGGLLVRVLHTPGHTPGSACFLVEDTLFTGDTFFVDGCGRVDLPDSDPAAMMESLCLEIGRLPDSLHVFPGHDYGGSTATLGEIRRTNAAFREACAT